MRKICSVHPPLLSSRVHRPFITRQFFKWLLKSELRKSAEEEISRPRRGKVARIDDSSQSLLADLQLENIGTTANISGSGADKRYIIAAFVDPNSNEAVHRVLIRTALHGNVDSNNISLSVRPEFLPEIAAEVINFFSIEINFYTEICRKFLKKRSFLVSSHRC